MNDFFFDYFTNKKIPIDEVLNSVIDGDNFFILQQLKKYYHNKIKLIYIDPPYNTKKKFTYKDNYGSHDDWVSMMKLRLEIARDLLKEDGFIFVSIDDNEVHYLRILMDSIFGEENFRNCIIIPRGIKNVQAQFANSHSIAVGHEYLLFYSKNKKAKIKRFELERKSFRKGGWNNHWRGTDRPNLRYNLFGITPQTGQWRWSKERSLKAISNYEKLLSDLYKLNELSRSDDSLLSHEVIDKWYCHNILESEKYDLLRLSKHGKPEHYIPPALKKIGSDVWTDLNTSGTRDLKNIIPEAVFDMPKPVLLIKRIVELITCSKSEDIILDFFAGSGSTGQAVLELNREDLGNRKFILVQIAEKINGLSSYEVFTLSQLAYKRIDLYMKKNNLNYNFKFLKYSSLI